MKKRKFKPMFEVPMLSFVMGQDRIGEIVTKEAKKDKDVIYGTRAMNVQLPGLMQRETIDWDVYTRQPKRKAQRVQGIFDREIVGGEDDFFAKAAKHKGTWKVMHEGFDQKKRTRDDIPVVDYTRMPRKVSVRRVGGIRHESLSSISMGKRKILKDPKSAYRHEKDREDLGRIMPVIAVRKILKRRM